MKIAGPRTLLRRCRDAGMADDEIDCLVASASSSLSRYPDGHLEMDIGGERCDVTRLFTLDGAIDEINLNRQYVQ